MVFQMNVYCDCSCVDDGYVCECGTNPYTGQYMERFIKVVDDEDEEEEEIDECGNDRRDYGMGWYDCNTDWRSWNKW